VYLNNLTASRRTKAHTLSCIFSVPLDAPVIYAARRINIYPCLTPAAAANKSRLVIKERCWDTRVDRRITAALLRVTGVNQLHYQTHRGRAARGEKGPRLAASVSFLDYMHFHPSPEYIRNALLWFYITMKWCLFAMGGIWIHIVQGLYFLFN
jgi:hypothetical protein